MPGRLQHLRMVLTVAHIRAHDLGAGGGRSSSTRGTTQLNTTQQQDYIQQAHAPCGTAYVHSMLFMHSPRVVSVHQCLQPYVWFGSLGFADDTACCFRTTLLTPWQVPAAAYDGTVNLLRGPTRQHTFDVVLFHGLQPGDYTNAWRTTWEFEGSKNQVICSLYDCIAQQYPGARVLSVSYDSSARQSAGGRGKNDWDVTRGLVAGSLCGAGVGRLPVVFIGHSLGGLIMEQVFWEANRRSAIPASFPEAAYAGVINNMRGMLYYGTPLDGSPLANAALALAKFLPWPLSKLYKPGAMMQYITTLSESAATDKSYFIQLYQNIPDSTRFRRDALYENVPLRLGGFNAVVVPRASATSGIGGAYGPLRADHINMCKPVNPNDRRFLELAAFLSRCQLPP